MSEVVFIVVTNRFRIETNEDAAFVNVKLWIQKKTI
jgi:hypothetical protein